MKKVKIGYILLGFIIALTNCISLLTMSVSAAAVTPTNGNIYYIKNLNSGLYLQVENDSAKDGANVCQANGTGSTGQKWIINDNGDGTIRIKSALDMTGGLALDIPNGVGDNLTNVQVWSSNGLAPQNFKLVDNGNGYYAIATQASDFARCLDVLSWSKDDGANVMQYDITMGENQLWAFEEASWPSSSSNTTTTTTTTTTTEKQTEATTKATTTATNAQSKSWNFSNSNFRSLGTITNSTTVDGLKLIATSSKTMEVRQASATVDSNSYSYCLALGGSGSASYRAVALDISGKTTIKVTAQSSGSSDRTLNVVDASGKTLGTVNAGTSAAVGSVATNYSGTVYIYSAGSGINIYKVQIDTTGSIPSGSSEVTTEATTQATTKATTTTTKVTTTTEKQTEATTAATAKTKSWNFSNSNFKGLGTISSNKTVDGLKLVANSSKTMDVRAVNATVDSNSYTYCLALGGSGSTSYRAVAIDISGKTTIKVTAQSSGSSARTLNVVDASGKTLGTINAGTSAAVGSVATNYSGTVYIYSAGSGINIFKVQIDTTGSLPGGSSESATEATTQATTKVTTTEKQTEATTKAPSGNSVTVSDFSSLVSAVKSMANNGGTVYVDAKRIDCTAQLALNSTKGKEVKIVGVKQSDGTYPILDFATFRNNTIGSTGKTLSASGDANVGVRITGSNYTLQNLIIQKAGDNGIQIKGSSANYNTVYNCIVRYNNDAGVQITNGASYNAMKFVYSYRNCDIYTRGGNSDGFAPKLGATTGNTFYGCYAWDNSDDGWDSFDKTDSGYTKDLSYEECACWNNGNPDVFTGKYDFENGNSLDTNLYLVELITKQDSSFASNYKNGKFSLPSGNFIKTDAGTISLSSWIGSSYDGNPNGFKFGSVNSKSSLVRTVKNCVAFNHKMKGFDNNNSSCTGSFTNCVSFDNGYNYYLPPFTMKKWTNIYGFNGASKDKLPSGYSASTPSSSVQSSIRSTVKSTSNDIMNKCNKDIIPGEVYFNIY